MALALIGSGELTPTMVELHKGLLRDVDAPAVFLDSPYGFQTNREVLSEKIEEYFRVNVGHDIARVALAGPELDSRTAATARVRLRTAGYAFAGPGSPTYALRVLRAAELREELVELVEDPARHLVLASAASITAGTWSLPVYEIYKVGEAPRLDPGLDLLRGLGVRTVVVPHWDNQEGGNHDTSCCYVGRARLDAALAGVAWDLLLGIDEHTCLTLDPLTARGRVFGRGRVLVMTVDGRRQEHAAGDEVDLATLIDAGRDSPTTASGPSRAAVPAASGTETDGLEALDSLLGALVDGDLAAAAGALARLAPDAFRSAQAQRGLLVALDRVLPLSATSTPEPDLLARLEAVRDDLRERRDFAGADAVRDVLALLGVPVRGDAPVPPPPA